MGLSNLPTELLQDIFAALDSTHDINSLLQSCRRFCELSSSLLYEYAVENCCAETSQWAGNHGRVDVLKRLIAIGSDTIIHTAETTPLFTAAENGRVTVMHFLIDQGIDLNMETTVADERCNAIHIAAKNGHEAIVRQLLDAGVEVDTQSRYDSTAIVMAASRGHDSLVSFLLGRGASVAAKDGFERTALCYAAGNCSLPSFQKLLEETPHEALREILEDYDDLQRTPLSYAAECGNLDVVKLLFKKGVDPYGPDKAHTPLRVAIQYDQNHVVGFLLDEGVCPNELQTPRQYAPLPLAADCGNDAAVRMLLEKGADINYVLPWGETPLGLASWKGHYGIVERLLNAGAPIDYESHGSTYLDTALRHGHGEIALLLLRRGADHTTCSNGGSVTLLSLGVRNNDHELVKMRLEDDVDLELRDLNGNTALMVAAMNARTDMARVLVQNGADIYAHDLWGRTPLAIAAERGWLGVVLAILDCRHGAQQTTPSCASAQHAPSAQGRIIDIADEYGRTPLFYATANGHYLVVAALLARGSIAFDCTTSAGRSPRSVAAQWVCHPDLSKRDALLAILRMFDEPHKTNKVSVDVVEEMEEGRIVSSPFFDEMSDWDLRQRLEGEYKCHHCPALVNKDEEHFFCGKCEGEIYCHNVEDGLTICLECVAGGKHCLDEGHVLQRICKLIG